MQSKKIRQYLIFLWQKFFSLEGLKKILGEGFNTEPLTHRHGDSSTQPTPLSDLLEEQLKCGLMPHMLQIAPEMKKEQTCRSL